MESRRRTIRNKLNIEIRDANTFVTRSEDTIRRLKNSDMGEEYVLKQIDKLKIAISDKKELVEKLNKELLKVDYGGMDDEIDKEYKNTKSIIHKKQKETARIKAVKNDAKQADKEISQKYWKSTVATSRAYRQKMRDIRYAHKYSCKVASELPPYMQKNLSEMPNNKGYIWRGVHFYGGLPEQQGPRVMFEKQRGGILVIHEHTNREYRRYEKQGKNRKTLVHKEVKRQKNTGPSLMDYVKQ